MDVNPAQAADPQPTPLQPVRVLMVCMGNICRSPMAEGVLRQRLAERLPELTVHVDSAGTHGYHAGSPPDERAQAAARRRGIDISMIRSRLVCDDDYASFDLILAMDEDNHAFLLERAPGEHHGKIRLYLDFAARRFGPSVPDPYYGGPVGFERVLDIVEGALDGVLAEIERLARRPAGAG